MSENDFEILKGWLENSRPDIVELQTLLTSIPAMAPESGGDGEWKKCAALKKWLIDRIIVHILKIYHHINLFTQLTHMTFHIFRRHHVFRDLNR